jgi:hypothetical protein
MYMWHKTNTLNKTLNWQTTETSGWIFQLERLFHRGQISLLYILNPKLLPRQKQQQMYSQCTVNAQFAQSMHSPQGSAWFHDIPFAKYTALFPFWSFVTWYLLSCVHTLRSPDTLLICIPDLAIPSSLLLAKHLPIHSTSTGNTPMPQGK